MLLAGDRLFPAQPEVRALARELHASVADLPLLCPHGHTDPSWYARDVNFADPVAMFITPDHYVVRMLYSQGVPMESMGIHADGDDRRGDPEQIWETFASSYHLFRGTPSRMWLDYCFQELFGLEERLDKSTARKYYQRISDRLASPAFSVRSLYGKFNIECIATTDSPLDSLEHHRSLVDEGWDGRVVPCYRPDCVIDPDRRDFVDNVKLLGQLTGCDTETWRGYLEAHRVRRAEFRALGATATDHGHPTARTASLGNLKAGSLFNAMLYGDPSAEEKEMFRAQMLTEMARMSLDDGMTMQLHAGSWRNHNRPLFESYGPDRGADLPMATDFVGGLQPLLSEFGNSAELQLILFTLDETTYARELAPLAGHYPAVKLGPPWWFFDSFEGMMRYRRAVTETAGFYNTVGFNDDTRAFLSIPARHDMARRADCAYLAELVADHRLDQEEAMEVAQDLSYNLAKRAYRL